MPDLPDLCLVQSSFHWHFPASVSEELPEKREEFISWKMKGCACFLPITGNFKPDLPFVLFGVIQTKGKIVGFSSSVVFLLCHWWSHICSNLRPISVQLPISCCFVTAYCVYVLWASPALNCLVCTKARVIFTAVSSVELCSIGRILFCILHPRSKQPSEGSGICPAAGDGEERKMRFSL